MKLLGVSKSRNRYYIYVDSIPLVGHIAFGVLDRGTNVLQIRPTTICPFSCLYCSVDAGPFSRHRLSEYIVDWKHLIKWVRHVYDIKGGEVVEGLIDGVGEPPTHPNIVEIVEGLKKFLPRVAMETRGATLSVELINRLEEARLDRFNISIDTLNPEKARHLQGVPWYNPLKVKEIVEYIVLNTKIDVHIAPVWIPGVNDRDIEEIVEWALRVGVGKRFPPLGIQKYEIHRYGRRIPGIREPSWDEFKAFLERLEQKYGVPLYYKKLDFGIRKASKRLKPRYEVGETVAATAVAPGWLQRELLAVDSEWSTIISVVGLENPEEYVGKKLRVRIVENSNAIMIARLD